MNEDRPDIWEQIVEGSKATREVYPQITNYANTLWKAMACLRRAYYDRMDPIDEGDDWYMDAQLGNWIHSMIVDWIKKAGLWRGDEVRGGNEEFQITYRIDALIADNPIDPTVVHPLEIKSMKDEKYVRYKNKKIGAHVVQLQCYLHFHQPTPYDYGYLLYFNRNVPQVTLTKIDYDPMVGKAIEEILGKLNEAIYLDRIPEIAKDDYECKYCPYKKRCTTEK